MRTSLSQRCRSHAETSVIGRACLRGLLALIAACIPASVTAASDYSVIQELSAVASGDGELNARFGFSVAIDGDLAVAATLGGGAREPVVRTYARNGASWSHLPGHDIQLRSRGIVKMSFNEGTLAVIVYDASESSSSMGIYRYTSTRWDKEDGFTTSGQLASVATTESIAVVGIPDFEGLVGAKQGLIFILRRQSDGTWNLATQLPNVPRAQARFGWSVAIVAGAIVVGAVSETVTGQSGTYAFAGAAYVYELTQDTWSQVARLVEPDVGNRTNNHFGYTVAISGADPSTPDRMLIGNAPSSGPLFRSYKRVAGTWTPGFTMTEPVPGAEDGFGCSLAMDKDWAVIGMCYSDSAGTNAGAVLLARFDSDFTHVRSLTERTDPQAMPGNLVGASVAIDREGPTVIVGNYYADLYGNERQGVVLIGRSQSGELPVLSRALDLGQGLTGARAAVVAADGDTLLLGALNEDVGVQYQRGAVYVYKRRPDGRYAFESRLLAPDGTADDQFGSVIALKGDIALISATGRSHMGEDQAGAVYAFHRDGEEWTLEAQFLPPDPGHETRLGFSLGLDGNTAFLGEVGQNTTVLERSDIGLWTIVQSIPYRALAMQVQGDLALLGDREANGYIGEVAIYTRDGNGWQRSGTLSGSDSGQRFGSEISLDGDRAAVTSGSLAASVQIFQRNGSTWLPQASLLPYDTTSTAGCTDVALRGAMLAISCLDGGAGNFGAVYVYERSGGLWNESQKLTLPDPGDLDVFGSAIAWTDRGSLLASSFGREVDFVDQGAVYVYRSDVLFQYGFE